MAEHAVDLLQIDDPGLVADRFNQRAEAEVFRAAQLALFGALATCERVGGEGVVADAGAVEFGEDELCRHRFPWTRDSEPESQ